MPPTTARPRILMVATIAATVRGFLLPYARHLRARGWGVDAAARGLSTEPDVADAFDAIHDLPLTRSLRDPSAMLKALSVLRGLAADGYDIVHVHTPIAGFVARYAVRRTPRRLRPTVIYTAHGFHFHAGGRAWTNGIFLGAERVASRWTDHLIVINAEDEAAARRYRLVPTGSLHPMPGIGVDTDHYARAALQDRSITAARASMGLSGTAPLIAVVGELNRNKRPGDVLEAVARMRHPDVHLAYMGDGRGRAALERRIDELGLRDRVHVLGTVKDVRPVVAAASVVVLSSTREGLPRSIMEALCLEVPVVASAARGCPDLVLPDGGAIYPTGDVVALSEALDGILDDPAAAAAMGRAGRARMVSRYSIDALVDRHETLYDDIIAERG